MSNFDISMLEGLSHDDLEKIKKSVDEKIKENGYSISSKSSNNDEISKMSTQQKLSYARNQLSGKISKKEVITMNDAFEYFKSVDENLAETMYYQSQDLIKNLKLRN